MWIYDPKRKEDWVLKGDNSKIISHSIFDHPNQSFNDMIKAGADLYARNITGDVPLHEVTSPLTSSSNHSSSKACRTGSITAVKVMAEQRGIELDSSNLQKETPLHHAARRGEKRIVRILLEKDVNFGAESESGTAAQVNDSTLASHLT